mgnify:CR=1 FL=1
MKINIEVTPKQHELILMLLREEAIVGRHGEKHRATMILQKLGE